MRNIKPEKEISFNLKQTNKKPPRKYVKPLIMTKKFMTISESPSLAAPVFHVASLFYMAYLLCFETFDLYLWNEMFMQWNNMQQYSVMLLFH